MLNKEKFKDEIVEIATNVHGLAKVNGKLCNCCDVLCNDCDFCSTNNNNGHTCDLSIQEWANSEYVEQVDWSKIEEGTPIWVRNFETCEWIKRIFVFKSKKGFVCVCSGEESKEFPYYVAWKYARLDKPFEEKQNE